MAPILHLVRHAQGFHNLGVEFHSITDPRLTPLGESQCATLCSSLGPAFLSNISLITASPLSRTIHTAFCSFQPILESAKAGSGKCKPEILALPDTQEISDYPCDTGSDVGVLRAACKEHGWPVDLRLVQEGWNVKTGKYAPDTEHIQERARDARRLLRSKIQELVESGVVDPEVVLVTHGGYLHYFTNDWEDATSGLGTGWKNCEIRSYNYEAEQDENAWIVETRESRARRGKEGPMKDRPEQEALFGSAMTGWADQGLTTPLSVSGPMVDTSAEEGMESIERTLTAESRGSTVKVSA